MKSAWIVFWTVAVASVGGLLFLRNTKKYRQKSGVWRIGKSTIELLLLCLMATCLPALLIAWICMWICKPIKRPWVKATVGILSGVTLGFCSHFALEALVVLGAFGIDLKTGNQDGGFLQHWRRAAKREEEIAAA